jgi:alkanesulfonate monooxygenase SsuD/methylene tetrahydromethanopterin reductase-like flavin-dependent oxidoreductase (luciferase family)
VPIYIAALRERMLQTAGEIGDGAFLNYTPLSGLPTVLAEIRKGEEAAGKEPGSTDVMCRFFCIQGDPEQGLGLARWMFAAYATVPVYENFFRWLGHGDAIDPMVEAWRAKDRQKALELVPTELVQEIFVLGDADAQRARLQQYVDGGVNVPMVLPIPIVAPGTPVDAATHVELVESLAPA